MTYEIPKTCFGVVVGYEEVQFRVLGLFAASRWLFPVTRNRLNAGRRIHA
jgi:hypothetical protein